MASYSDPWGNPTVETIHGLRTGVNTLAGVLAGAKILTIAAVVLVGYFVLRRR